MESLNDSADIFANSSAETVTENSAYLNEKEDKPYRNGSVLKDRSNEINNYIYNKGSNRDYDKKGGHHSYEHNKEKMGDIWGIGRIRSPLCASSPLMSSDWEDSSLLSERLVSEVCQPPVRLYCPFCPLDYGFEFLLKDHVRGVHSAQVKAVATAAPGAAMFFPCPFCHAKFYLRELLPKHISKKHAGNLADICCTRNTGDPDHLECAFCSHRVLEKHRKLLAVHIEKKHYAAYEAKIYRDYCSEGGAPNEGELASWCLDGRLTITTQVHPGGIASPRHLLIRPILKTPTSKHSCASDQPSPVLSEGDTDATESSDVNARRRLRFDLPDSPPEGSKLKSAFGKKKTSGGKWKFLSRAKGKENSSPKKKKQFECGFCQKGFDKKSELSEHGRDCQSRRASPLKPRAGKGRENRSPKKQPHSGIDEGEEGPVVRFKCGLCLVGFHSNLELVEHTVHCNKSSMLNLRARYRCAQCHAKFYRNSFLVRHSARHHSRRATPLCLKAKRLSIN